jgi:hypothetical protein
MPLAGPPPRRAERAPRAALNASNDALRDWVPRNPAMTGLNGNLRKLSGHRRAENRIRGPPHWGRIGGPAPTGRGTFSRAHGARPPRPVLPDRLRRNADKLLERLARMVAPFRMQPGAYNFCQWRQVITPQFVGSENGQTAGTKKPARGGLSVPVWRSDPVRSGSPAFRTLAALALGNAASVIIT